MTPNIGVTANGKADSAAKAAVANGTIEVRSNPNQDISGLSRDTVNALNTLGKIFDKKTVQEQQELANLFGEEAYKAIGDLANSQLTRAVDDANRGSLTGGNPTTTGSVTLSGTKYNADVPKLLLSPIIPGINAIPDSWIDNVFNPGLKAVFTKIGTDGLQPNQYKCFAVDVGEGVGIRVEYIIDGTGNVYEVTGLGLGASAFPVSVNGTIGIAIKPGEEQPSNREQMQDAMNGYSVGFSCQSGVQGSLSMSLPTGIVYGEVGLVSNAGIGVMGTKTNFLFNIKDE